jgi:hypothetical protein
MMPCGKGETGELRAAGRVAVQDVEGDAFDHGLTKPRNRVITPTRLVSF